MTQATDDQLDDVEPTPAPRPRNPLGGLIFRQPSLTEEEKAAATAAVQATALGPLLLPPGDSPSESESPLDELPDLDPSDDPPSSSEESRAGDPAGLPVVGKRALQQTARRAVKISTRTAHGFLAKSHGQRAVQLYVADDEDAANIGNPAGSLLSRRTGTAGKLTEDQNDALQMVLGLGGFIAKQIVAAQEAAAIDVKIASGELHVVTEADDL